MFERIFNVICFGAIFALSILSAFSEFLPKDIIPLFIFLGFIGFIGTAFNAVNMYLLLAGYNVIQFEE